MLENEISNSGFVTKEDINESVSSFLDFKEIETKGYCSLYIASYLGNEIKDLSLPYIDWTRESFQLIYDNLKPGEEIISDPENPSLFIIITDAQP